MSEPLTIQAHDLWQQAKQQLLIPQLIQQAIQRQIITTAAHQQGIKVSLAELQASADQLRIQHQLLTAQATIDWLAKHQLIVEDLEDIAHTNILIEKLKTAIVEPQVAPYFYQHQLDYAQAIYYEVVVSQHELAMELFYALQEHELDFLEVLHHYIDDRTTRLNGSYRHVVRRQDLSAEMAATMFAIQPPQLLRPFTNSDGTHLIYVAEILPPVLDKSLQQEIRDWLFQCWLDQQRSQHQITIDIAIKQTPLH